MDPIYIISPKIALKLDFSHPVVLCTLFQYTSTDTSTLAKTQRYKTVLDFFFLMVEKRLYLVKENVFGLIQIGLLLCTSVVMFAANMIYKIIARCL